MCFTSNVHTIFLLERHVGKNKNGQKSEKHPTSPPPPPTPPQKKKKKTQKKQRGETTSYTTDLWWIAPVNPNAVLTIFIPSFSKKDKRARMERWENWKAGSMKQVKLEEQQTADCCSLKLNSSLDSKYRRSHAKEGPSPSLTKVPNCCVKFQDHVFFVSLKAHLKQVGIIYIV